MDNNTLRILNEYGLVIQHFSGIFDIVLFLFRDDIHIFMMVCIIISA